MMGEEMNACDLTEQGFLGDRVYGLIDTETGKLADAKNPKKWPSMFHCRASFTAPVELSKSIPSVRITLPNGQSVVSSEIDINDRLSKSFQRSVTIASPSSIRVEFEGYIPEEIKELDNRAKIFSRQSPEDTFFDIAMVHIITTATIEMLRKLAPDSRIEPRRFRPNLILDVPGAEGFVEQQWIDKILSIGDDVQLKIIQPTQRCIMTTLAQGDLPKDPNLLRTLAKQNNGNFGVYAQVIKTGQVKIGNEVTIL